MKKTIVKKSEKLDVKEYAQLFEHIKTDILQSQIRAAQAVTQELTHLYWRIGKALSEKIAAEGWGAKVVEKLAKDLVREFPGMAGFSLRNMRYMRKFAESYPNSNFAAAAAKLPWGHHMVLLDSLDSNDQRMWYAEKAIQNNWSRASLVMWLVRYIFASAKTLTTDGYQTKRHYNYFKLHPKLRAS